MSSLGPFRGSATIFFSCPVWITPGLNKAMIRPCRPRAAPLLGILGLLGACYLAHPLPQDERELPFRRLMSLPEPAEELFSFYNQVNAADLARLQADIETSCQLEGPLPGLTSTVRQEHPRSDGFVRCEWNSRGELIAFAELDSRGLPNTRAATFFDGQLRTIAVRIRPDLVITRSWERILQNGRWLGYLNRLEFHHIPEQRHIVFQFERLSGDLVKRAEYIEAQPEPVHTGFQFTVYPSEGRPACVEIRPPPATSIEYESDCPLPDRVLPGTNRF